MTKEKLRRQRAETMQKEAAEILAAERIRLGGGDHLIKEAKEYLAKAYTAKVYKDKINVANWRLTYAERALYAHPQPQQADGRGAQSDYVLMPREATRAMTMAGCDSLPSCEHVFGYAGEMLRNAYRKMVQVGQQSPATDGPAK